MNRWQTWRSEQEERPAAPRNMPAGDEKVRTQRQVNNSTADNGSYCHEDRKRKEERQKIQRGTVAVMATPSDGPLLVTGAAPDQVLVRPSRARIPPVADSSLLGEQGRAAGPAAECSRFHKDESTAAACRRKRGGIERIERRFPRGASSVRRLPALHCIFRAAACSCCCREDTQDGCNFARIGRPQTHPGSSPSACTTTN